MASYCSTCGKKLGFFSAISTIRSKEYCFDCAKNIPSCDKCRYHTTYGDHAHGECQYLEVWLKNYDDICEHYSR